jgi:hypothetical protein
MPSLFRKLLGKVGRKEKGNKAGGHDSIPPSQSSRVALQAGAKAMGDFTKILRPFYPSLSSRNREIRLLHLQPGAEAEELQCRLIVASLDSSPSYEALSYRWAGDTSSVLVDGHKVRISQNLEHALRKMRFSEKERVLWADAICID